MQFEELLDSLGIESHAVRNLHAKLELRVLAPLVRCDPPNIGAFQEAFEEMFVGMFRVIGFELLRQRSAPSEFERRIEIARAFTTSCAVERWSDLMPSGPPLRGLLELDHIGQEVGRVTKRFKWQAWKLADMNGHPNVVRKSEQVVLGLDGPNLPPESADQILSTLDAVWGRMQTQKEKVPDGKLREVLFEEAKWYAWDLFSQFVREWSLLGLPPEQFESLTKRQIEHLTLRAIEQINENHEIESIQSHPGRQQIEESLQLLLEAYRDENRVRYEAKLEDASLTSSRPNGTGVASNGNSVAAPVLPTQQKPAPTADSQASFNRLANKIETLAWDLDTYYPGDPEEMADVGRELARHLEEFVPIARAVATGAAGSAPNPPRPTTTAALPQPVRVNDPFATKQQRAAALQRAGTIGTLAERWSQYLGKYGETQLYRWRDDRGEGSKGRLKPWAKNGKSEKTARIERLLTEGGYAEPVS
jgi:hypothetical protein